MTHFEWDQALETSCEPIDTRHESLFNIASGLHKIAEQNPQDQDAITEAVYGVVGSVVDSFREEEALMREYDYPGIDRHRTLHRRLAADVLDFAAHYLYGEDLEPAQLAFLVEKWLRRHILRYDMRMVAFIEHAKSARWAVESPRSRA
jgi:hemerythrin